MISKSYERLLVVLLALCGAGATLFITPTFSSEPVDQPKLTVIVIIGFAISGALLVKANLVLRRFSRILKILVLLFITQLFLVLAFAKSPFTQQFYGSYGRNTGFLAYISLIFIMLGSAVISTKAKLETLAKALIFTGLVSVAYSTIQTLGHDPVKWNNPNNPIIGFLGNPDFASSFLGIAGVALFAYALQQNLKPTLRVLAIFFVILSVLLIVRSHAQQGLLVFAAGSAFVAYHFLKTSAKLGDRKIIVGYLSLATVASIFVIAGTLKLGPLANKLYKISVRQRGFYWHAAIEMMNSHPLTGVGMDSYGDYYFKYRSANAAFHTPGTQSNTAHNIFLDLGSNGGWPLFLINLALCLLGFWAGLKVLKRENKFNWGFIAIFGSFVAYEAQAVVSINQLGIGIWGWILLGLIVGYEYQTRIPRSSISTKEIKPTVVGRRVKSKNGGNDYIYGSMAGLVVGLAIALPIFLNDHNYRIAQQSRNAQVVIAASLRTPEDLNRTLQTAQLLINSKLTPQAITLIDHVISRNPNSYGAWTLKHDITAPGSKEHNLAIKKLNELNPRVPVAQ